MKCFNVPMCRHSFLGQGGLGAVRTTHASSQCSLLIHINTVLMLFNGAQPLILAICVPSGVSWMPVIAVTI